MRGKTHRDVESGGCVDHRDVGDSDLTFCGDKEVLDQGVVLAVNSDLHPSKSPQITRSGRI